MLDNSGVLEIISEIACSNNGVQRTTLKTFSGLRDQMYKLTSNNEKCVFNYETRQISPSYIRNYGKRPDSLRSTQPSHVLRVRVPIQF